MDGDVQAIMSLAQDNPEKLASLIQQILESRPATSTTRANGFSQYQFSTINLVTSKYDIIAVKGLELSYLYKLKQDSTYKKIDKSDLEKIVSDAYVKVTGRIDGTHIEKIMKTLDKEVRRTNEVPFIDNRFIELYPGRFWDMEKGVPTKTIPEGCYCARRLFDTPSAGKNVVKYGAPSTPDYPSPALIEQAYEDALTEINATHGERLDPKFDFVMQWANDDPAIYKDIMLMYASMFMGKKPFGIWVLRGQGRNGKSVAVGLLHTIFGTNNTSRIQLGKIGDWHGYLQLANTLVNAADEEDNEVLKDEALIKTIADHGEIDLSKMREQTQLRVHANFGLALCSNSDLALKGHGNEAFIRRLRVIPFNRDFSSQDTLSTMRSFAEETFTPKVIARFVGTCMGYASYYMDNPFPLSESMMEQQRFLEENLVSYKVYYDQLKRFFHSFHRLKQDVYEDYLYWCADSGLDVNDFSDFKIRFKGAMSKKNQSTNSTCGDRVTIHIIPESANGKQCLRNEYFIPELRQTIEELHKSHKSAVFELNNYYELHKGEEDEQLRLPNN